MAVNEANSDTWKPITTSFHPHLSGVDETNGVVVFGRNSEGEVVATQATRYFDWRTTTLKQEAESMRLFYANPERDMRDNEACLVNSPDAGAISGNIVLSGAIWYRPDYRGIGLANIIPRFIRAVSFVRWDIDEFIGLITAENTAKAFSQRTGLGGTSGSIIFRNHEILPGKDFETRLARIAPMQMIDDLFGFMLDFNAQVDPGINMRRA
ncbi:MAG: hypothetical protein JXQ99_06220 [Hyphomicrobiaceae bacterium]